MTRARKRRTAIPTSITTSVLVSLQLHGRWCRCAAFAKGIREVQSERFEARRQAEQHARGQRHGQCEE
jgi:hypothetical protein